MSSEQTILFSPIQLKLLFLGFSYFLNNELTNNLYVCVSVIICPEFQRTYIATVSKILFLSIGLKLFSARFGPLRLRNCNKNFVCLSVVCLSVCLMSEFKVCHWLSGHSAGLFCRKFGTLVYLCDT